QYTYIQNATPVISGVVVSDPAGRVTTVRWTNVGTSAVLDDFGYKYDDLDRLLLEGRSGGDVQLYNYDRTNEVTKVSNKDTPDNPNAKYDFDSAGNQSVAREMDANGKVKASNETIKVEKGQLKEDAYYQYTYYNSGALKTKTLKPQKVDPIA